MHDSLTKPKKVGNKKTDESFYEQGLKAVDGSLMVLYERVVLL